MPETPKLFGGVNNASEVLHLEAGLEEGQAGDADDFGEEADGYVTTESSSSETDDAERELVQR